MSNRWTLIYDDGRTPAIHTTGVEAETTRDAVHRHRLFAGPVSGESMNPARSLAPALVSRQLGTVWVYLAGPTLGPGLGVPVCRYIRGPGCCRAVPVEEVRL